MVDRFRNICLLFLLSFSFTGTAQEWEVRIDSFSSFSSPKAFDLNGDGTKDIIVGCGFEFDIEDGVFALDGTNGDVLWFTPSDHEIYGPAVAFDITEDGIPDFVMNGRFGALIAIDGSNGNTLWRLTDDPDLPENPSTQQDYNVFTPCRIEDVNADEIDDVLFTYGGGGGFRINDTIDHAFVGILSGADGQILQIVPLPTNSQTYMPPLLLESGGSLDVIAGTGGETHGGELFRFPLQSLINGHLNGIITIASNPLKGYIQPPALADVNGDGVEDMLVVNLDHQIFAYDGADNRNLYTNYFPEMEFYGGPTPGYFNSDDVLDFSVLGGVGKWPFYGGFRRYIIDVTVGGGILIDEIGGGLEVVNSGISYQPDASMRRSNLIYTRNDIYNDSVKHLQVVEYDPFTDTEWVLAELDSASVVGCVPLIDDLDNDGLLELVVVASDYASGFGEPDNRLIVKVMDVDRSGISHWNGYMGNLSDSHWQGETVVVSASNDPSIQNAALEVYPNPFSTSFSVRLPEDRAVSIREADIVLHAVDGRCWSPANVDFSHGSWKVEMPAALPAGIYQLGVSGANGIIATSIVHIP